MATKSKASTSPKLKRKRKSPQVRLRNLVFVAMNNMRDNQYDTHINSSARQAVDLREYCAELETESLTAIRRLVVKWREQNDPPPSQPPLQKEDFAMAAAKDIENLFHKTFVIGARVHAIASVVQSAISMALIHAEQAREHEDRGCKI